MIKRIIFDMDDTIMEFPKDYEIHYDEVLKKYNINVSAKTLYEAVGDYENNHGYIYYDKEELEKVVNKYLNLNINKDFYRDFYIMYDKLSSNIEDELFDTLDYLSEKYELVILSNWFTDCQKARLKKAGLLKYFKEVYGADKVPMKPFKESYISCIGNNKIEECLVIGDSIKKDVEIPDELGFQVYHFSKEKSKYPNIDKLTKLKELL